MMKKILIILLIFVLVVASVLFITRRTATIEFFETNKTKTIRMETNTFIVEFPTDYIKARIGDEVEISFDIKILKNTTVYFLTKIVPIGVGCEADKFMLEHSDIVKVRFKVYESANIGEVYKIWLTVEDDLGNSVDIWMNIEVIS
ncbi:MAG: hypothetical protein QXO07_02945 [Candidatus Aenigmatarchaeota archaeon]